MHYLTFYVWLLEMLLTSFIMPLCWPEVSPRLNNNVVKCVIIIVFLFGRWFNKTLPPPLSFCSPMWSACGRTCTPCHPRAWAASSRRWWSGQRTSLTRPTPATSSGRPSQVCASWRARTLSSWCTPGLKRYVGTSGYACPDAQMPTGIFIKKAYATQICHMNSNIKQLICMVIIKIVIRAKGGDVGWNYIASGSVYGRVGGFQGFHLLQDYMVKRNRLERLKTQQEQLECLTSALQLVVFLGVDGRGVQEQFSSTPRNPDAP